MARKRGPEARVRDATRLTPDTAKQADGSARDDNGRGSPVRPPGKKSASSSYGQIVSIGSLVACRERSRAELKLPALPRHKQAAVALCCKILSLLAAILHPGPWVEGRLGAACASRKRRQAQ
jgi:hypothetical protein